MIALLGGLATFAPLSFDMYLPAFPQLSRTFEASASEVQLTLTAALVGLGLGQIFVGSVSDVLGRRRPLMVGLCVYVAASIFCAFAPSISVLVVLRFVQGFAGGAGVVMSRAVVRDLYVGAPAVRFFSKIMMVNGAAPILAPSIGSLVLHVTDWRGIFLVLAGLGVVLLVLAAVWLPETLPPERRRVGGAAEALQGFGILLRDPVFVGYAGAQGLLVAAVFAYIAGSSFVLQDIYGLTPGAFALTFGLNGIGLVIGGQLSGTLVRRHEPRTLLVAGLVSFSIWSVALLTAILLDVGLVAILPALCLTVSSVGFVVPNGTALALQNHPEVAGSAAALLGVFQNVTAAVIAPFVGIAGSTSAVPMGVVMCLLGATAITMVATLTTRRAPQRVTAR